MEFRAIRQLYGRVSKIEEMRRHAYECRHLAQRGDKDARDQLLKMAETWDSLADERERKFSGDPKSTSLKE